MANIIVESKSPVFDGMPLTFRAACDCTEISGLVVKFPNISGDSLDYESKQFAFKDALGNTLTGLGNLFAKGAYVRVILDTANSFAYIQNPGTNGYLEGRLAATAIIPGMVKDGVKYFHDVYTEDELNEKLTEFLETMDTCTVKETAFYSTDLFRTSSLVKATLYRDSTTRFCVASFIGVVSGCVTRWQKSYDGSTWSALEWENPPMAVDVEYRTTERYLGKPVYAKLVDFGALPNATKKTVAYCADPCTPVHLAVTTSNGAVLSGDGKDLATSSSVITVTSTKYSVVIQTEVDMSATTAHALVKYIKD